MIKKLMLLPIIAMGMQEETINGIPLADYLRINEKIKFVTAEANNEMRKMAKDYDSYEAALHIAEKAANEVYDYKKRRIEELRKQYALERKDKGNAFQERLNKQIETIYLTTDLE